MKCWIYFFTVCVIASFNKGDAESAEKLVIKLKNNELGKESIELRGGHPVFRRDSHEDNDGQNEGKVEERLESNVDSVSSQSKEKLIGPNDKNTKKILDETLKRFVSEMAAGDPTDLMGNQHMKQAFKYNNLGRRFVPQYKYTEASNKEPEPEDNEPIPEKAPPELVLVVAKESALMAADKSTSPDNDLNLKKILRSGEYWNGVWKEEVDPAKMSLRSDKKKVLGSIKAKIKPGSEFYNVVSRLKKISPRLLYIINKKQL